MNIDRVKHNKFSANAIHSGPTITTQLSGYGLVNVVYGGGGSGLTKELLEKLNSIEFGAQKNQDAYSYLKISTTNYNNNDEKVTVSSTAEAQVPRDIADLSFVAANRGTSVELVTEGHIPETSVIITNVTKDANGSDITTETTYKVSYSKLETEIEGLEDPITTWPLIITWMSGPKLAVGRLLSTVLLLNDLTVKSYNSVSSSTIYEVVNDSEGLISVTITESTLTIFDRILFTTTETVDDPENEGQQITQTVVLADFPVHVRINQIIKIAGSTLWWLDEEGNVWTDRNVYSEKEISAYGRSDEQQQTIKSYLWELEDVALTALTKIDDGILMFDTADNKWHVKNKNEVGLNESLLNAFLAQYTGFVKSINLGTTSTDNSLVQAIVDLSIGGSGTSRTINLKKNTFVDLSTELTINKVKHFNDYITIGDICIKYNSSNKSLYVSHKDGSTLANFYATGEVTAYGSTSDSTAPEIKQYLSELNDVSFSNLTNGDLLQYNGTKWINGGSITWDSLTGKPSWITNTAPKYAGSSSVGGTATSANKVNSTLTFTGYSTGSFNGSLNLTITIPTDNSLLGNGRGYITELGSCAYATNAGYANNANTLDGYSSEHFAAASDLDYYLPLSGGTMTGTILFTNLWCNVLDDTFGIFPSKTNYNSVGSNSLRWYQGYINNIYTSTIHSSEGNLVNISDNLEVTGNIVATLEVTAYSDFRLKTNIKTLLNRGCITPVTYIKDNKLSIGFIALEVKELYPELVIGEETDNTYLSLNYAQYTAVLQALIIELKEEIDKLKGLCNTLVSKN